jgi:hypothetical protein
MNDGTMKEFLEKIARRNIPEDTNLMPRIAANLERKSLMMTLRARPLTAILLALFLLAILTGVAYAIGRSFGFSPATGIVETSSLRVLAEPVTLERDGFRVTVTEAAADSDHTVIRYQVEWLTPPPADAQIDSTCQGTPTLTLPDGSLIGEGVAAADGKGVLENGYWYRLEFPALARGQNDVNFVLPCLVPQFPGSLPRDWEFSLRLIPWDGTPLAPVHQVPTQVVPTEVTAQPTQSVTDYGINFALEQVIDLGSGYLFEGSATWTDANIQPYSVSPYSAHLTDSTGRVIPLQWAPSQTTPSGLMQSRWAFQSVEKPTAFPLTLTLDGYTFSLATQASFPLDFGSNPQPGQTWTLNLDLPVAGHALHIASATWVDAPDMSMLEFSLSSDESAVGAMLFDLQNSSAQGGGGGGAGEPQPGPFTATVYYENGFPSGVTQITVASLQLVVRTPWQTTWQP